MEKHYGKRFNKYIILMFLIVVFSLVGALGYYYYMETHQPAQDPKFSSLVTSINEVKKDEILYVRVKSDFINVRRTNVIKSDNIVGNVSLNDIYKVTDIKKGATFYWYYIVDKDGRKGCIPSGTDQLFVETIIKKNDVEQELSTISNYVDEDDIIITTAPSGSTTTSTTTTTVPTTTVTTTKRQGKTTTTKKVNPTTTTTKTPTTRVIPGISYRIYSSDVTPICTDNDCEYYVTVGACTDCSDGVEEPYDFYIKLYDESGNLIATNTKFKDRLTVTVPAGKYTGTAQLVGTDEVASIEFEIRDMRW